MAPPRPDPAGENTNTNVIVNAIKEQRRPLRWPIIVGTACLAGLIAIMMLGLGNRRAAHFVTHATGAPGSPTSTTFQPVQVEIKPAGQLWVDGHNHGSAPLQHLKLDQGTHTLMVKRGSTKIVQRIDVTADMPLVVRFLRGEATVEPG